MSDFSRSSALSLLANLNHSLRSTQKLGSLPAGNSSELSTTDSDPNLAAQIKWTVIPPGRAGTMETVALMRKLALNAASDPDFLELCRMIRNPVWLEHWARALYRYRPEVEEIVRTPQRMLQDLESQGYLEGDCDDISTFLAAILKGCSVPVRFAVIRYKHPTEFEHVFIEYRDPSGEWRPMDLTVNPGTVHEYLERMESYV